VLTRTRAAELLVSFPESDDDDDARSAADSPLSDAPPRTPDALPTDATEARLEAREAHRYLLAKAFFDCREYDRCAAVFLPGALPKGSVLGASPAAARAHAKGKAKQGTPTKATGAGAWVHTLSQKSLFLALYAKYLAGERRVNEDSEVILGPRDGGVANGELQGISVVLDEWFSSLPSGGRQPQGWLEYLYGIVLAKGKNESLAKDYFIRSVTYYTFNWAAWQELASLLGTAEEVSPKRVARCLS
jgi:anaphase-promoting complex subunit 8